MKIGIVSGHFSFLHAGHIEYIEASKNQCDYLVVVINNDVQANLKGSKKIIDEKHKSKIISALRAVDSTIISIDTDKTVCKTINLIRTSFPSDDMYFFNSGDRLGDNIESAEVSLCEKLGIKYVAIDLPKRYSSSELLKNIC